MKVCRKCGAPLRDTDRFCSQCGAKVPVSRQEKARERQRRRDERERKKIRFQTAPMERRRTLDNFEENESRSKALRTTVCILVVIVVLTFAAVLAYTWKAKVWLFKETGDGRENVVLMQSEEEEAGKVESELQGDLQQSQS